MGIQVRLETFAQLSVLGVAAGLTIAAILGKQVCGLGVLEPGVSRLSVGIGMIPRGEVGLIFAGAGRLLKVIDDATFNNGDCNHTDYSARVEDGPCTQGKDEQGNCIERIQVVCTLVDLI
jgi:Kef-type K+ transport system membrane component KefB